MTAGKFKGFKGRSGVRGYGSREEILRSFVADIIEVVRIDPKHVLEICITSGQARFMVVQVDEVGAIKSFNGEILKKVHEFGILYPATVQL